MEHLWVDECIWLYDINVEWLNFVVRKKESYEKNTKKGQKAQSGEGAT